MTRRTGIAQLLSVVVALALTAAAAGPARSQHGDDTGSAGLPPGEGTLRGTAVHPEAPKRAAGLEIALFGLLPDGSGGVGHATTDARGEFSFENISTDPNVLYLVGVHYREVAFSQRTRFAPDQNELAVVLEISDPVSGAPAEAIRIRVLKSSIHLAWLGGVVAVSESQLLHNASTSIASISSDERADAQAPFRAVLPAGARDFASPLGDEESFSRDGDEIRYWGPLRPGNQEIRYVYHVPVEGREIDLRFGFPNGTAALQVLFPAESGLEVESGQLEAGRKIALKGEKALDHLRAADLGPDSQLELTLRLPETRNDPDALTLGAASLRVELDDAVLQVIQEQRIHVAPGSPLAGDRNAPLLQLELPPGAELEPLPAAAVEMGMEAGASGSLDLLGPLMPGEYDVTWRYRIPARDGLAHLELRFPRDIPVLDMRVADTGVVIESDRLHRLRPRAMGTRVYLLRGAWHVEAGETVFVGFRALRDHSRSRKVALVAMLALAVAAALFVTAPLRPAPDAVVPKTEMPDSTAAERELLYDSIRDLDHDFETGKIAEADYQQMRDELRGQAIALLRTERETTGRGGSAG